jgi:hypothetical protein
MTTVPTADPDEVKQKCMLAAQWHDAALAYAYVKAVSGLVSVEVCSGGEMRLWVLDRVCEILRVEFGM